MINYILFVSPVIHKANGIMSYIDTLLSHLKVLPDIKVIVLIFFDKDKNDFTVMESDSVDYVYIPKPLMLENFNTLNHAQQLNFSKSIYLLTKEYLKGKERLVFHLNHPSFYLMAKVLKQYYACKIISTIHFLEWRSKFEVKKEEYNDLNRILSDKNADYSLFQSQFENELLEVSDLVICVTKSSKKELGLIYPKQKKKLHHIYNGIALEPFHNLRSNQQNKKEIKKELGFDEQDKIIVYFGRVSEAKGVFYLVEAFKRIVDRCPNARLIISGTGDFDKLFSVIGGFWNKIMVTGHLEREKLNQLLTIADLSVIPSLHEHCSYTALEVLASGTPAISTNTGGLAEIFKHKVFSKIEIDPSGALDADSLASEMLGLLADGKRMKKMSKVSKEVANDHFSSTKMINSFVNLLHLNV